jgi:hypothetical protein
VSTLLYTLRRRVKLQIPVRRFITVYPGNITDLATAVCLTPDNSTVAYPI